MTLYIRTQASREIGMGHFMRCFALAEAARAKGVAVTFVMDASGETVKSRCAAIGAGLIVTGATVASDADIGAMIGLGLTRSDWLLIDSYAADADYIALQSQATQVAVLDDLALLDRYDCALVINPAMAADGMGYGRKARGRCLLGADFALIRAEFRQAPRPHPTETAISLMFGGSDPTGQSEIYALALHTAVPEAIVQVIVGPANTHTNTLLALAQRIQNIRIVANPPSVADVLAGSALVVTAAGGSVGEVAALGLPALVLVVYDNQMAALSACPFPTLDARNGLPEQFRAQVRALIDDREARAHIAAAAHALVDGQGPYRILEAMNV